MAVEIDLDNLTFLIGPNGSGKTATLQALCRMFAFDPALRQIHKSDFHIPSGEEEAPACTLPASMMKYAQAHEQCRDSPTLHPAKT